MNCPSPILNNICNSRNKLICVGKILCECCECNKNCKKITSILKYCNYDKCISHENKKAVDCVRESGEFLILLEIKNQPYRNINSGNIIKQFKDTINLIKDNNGQKLPDIKIFLCVPKDKQKKRREIEPTDMWSFTVIKSDDKNEENDIMIYAGLKPINIIKIPGIKIVEADIILCEDSDIECK